MLSLDVDMLGLHTHLQDVSSQSVSDEGMFQAEERSKLPAFRSAILGIVLRVGPSAPVF